MKESFEEKNSRKLQTKPRQPRSALIRNIAILVLSVAFLVTGVTMVYAESLLGRINTVVDESTAGDNPFEQTSADPGTIVESKPEDHPEADDEGLKKVGGLWHDDMIANILVMGVDDYQPNDPGRTDSMMLVTIDTRHQQLKVTSFMRDMYVAIPDYSSNRINTAYSIDGPSLLVSTIEANFGIDIDRWVVVDFSAFNEIIDAMGGVEITLKQEEADLVNRYSGDPRWNLSEGTFVLSGAQARYYSRIRAIGDDFERTERQRKVLMACMEKAKQASPATLVEILNSAIDDVSTNLDLAEMASILQDVNSYEIVAQDGAPFESNRTTGNIGSKGDCVVPLDLTDNVAMLHEFLFGVEDYTPSQQVQEYSEKIKSDTAAYVR